MSSSPTYTLDKLPWEILAQILFFLDIKSILSCSLTSKSLSKVVKERLWKDLVHRDLLPFLNQLALEPQQANFPSKESQIMTKNEYFPEAEAALEKLYAASYNSQKRFIRNDPSEWKQFYQDKYHNIDLNGYWLGDYGRHGVELIRIYQEGYNIVAKKITGDANIPAGKLTWTMHLDESLMKGKGELQVTEENYEDPKLSQAYLEVVNKNYVKITWLYQDSFNNWYTVSFANIRAGMVSFDEETMGRKIEFLSVESCAIKEQ